MVLQLGLRRLPGGRLGGALGRLPGGRLGGALGRRVSEPLNAPFAHLIAKCGLTTLQLGLLN